MDEIGVKRRGEARCALNGEALHSNQFLEGWGIACPGNDFGDQFEREMNRIRGAWAIGLAVGNAVEVYLIENGNVDALGRSLLGLRP